MDRDAVALISLSYGIIGMAVGECAVIIIRRWHERPGKSFFINPWIRFFLYPINWVISGARGQKFYESYDEETDKLMVLFNVGSEWRNTLTRMIHGIIWLPKLIWNMIVAAIILLIAAMKMEKPLIHLGLRIPKEQGA